MKPRRAAAPHCHPLALGLAWALAVGAAADTTMASGREVRSGPNWLLCSAPMALPAFRPAVPAVDPAQRELSVTVIEAERLDVSGELQTRFFGEVELSRADQWLASGELHYQHATQTWQSPGPLYYEDHALRLRAASGQGDLLRERLELEQVQYQLIGGTEGSGEAARSLREGPIGRLTDATFSSCPAGQRQWELRTPDLRIDEDRGRGTARNATLELGGVPVLWLPWISFPTSDARASGFLAPSLGYDDERGVDLELPYYFNLAPNYDATLTPRWMSRRGLMLGAEFRYLTRRSGGEFYGEWLHEDQLSGQRRSQLHWQHLTVINPRWQARMLLRDVSDPDYLRDFGSDFGLGLQALLDSHLTLAGLGRDWHASLSVDRWELSHPVLPPGSEPFARQPRLRAGWQPPLASWIETGIDLEVVRFHHAERAGGQRLDVQPRLRLPLGGPGWFLTPELGWRHTAWSLDPDPAAPARERRPSRSLPIARLDAGLVFERDLTLFGQSYLQTLEPRLHYLRVPFREQDDLPLFDTQPLSFSWPGLFRSNRYSGADRQADANQATLAITTRLLDAEDGRERFALGLGRIHYLDPPRVFLPWERRGDEDGSAWVGELGWQISEAWSLNLAQQWNPGALGSDLSALRSQYRIGERGVLNASYRFRRDLVEQTDLSFALPVGQQWRALGRWVWSIREERTLEALGGLEWRSCCMAVRLIGRDHIRDFVGERNLGVYLEIELNGLGRFGRDSERLLSDGILDFTP